MDATTVLVIDDEPHIRRAIRNALSADDLAVLEAATGSEGIDLAAAGHPALIILDLGLPDTAGAAVCREVRKWSSAPIIVLSARHSDQEKVALLDAGADDYVTKPFSTTELRARVRAQLRRARSSAGAADEAIVLGRLIIDLATPRLTREGESVHLTRTEWDLLRALVRHAGRTITHRQLFTEVWGNSHRDPQQNLRVHVRSLRRKIEADPVRPQHLVTEPGVGYRFELGP